MAGLAKRVKARILFTSTSEVYGDPEEHPQRESYWGHVNPIGPRACYDEVPSLPLVPLASWPHSPAPSPLPMLLARSKVQGQGERRGGEEEGEEAGWHLAVAICARAQTSPVRARHVLCK